MTLNPKGFGGSFTGIAPFQWLYILFVVVTFVLGVMGGGAVLLLIRNRANSYRHSVIALIGGTIVGVNYADVWHAPLQVVAGFWW